MGLELRTLDRAWNLRLRSSRWGGQRECHDGDGESDNMLISGAKSDQSDPLTKNSKTSWENAVMCRLIFKI